MGYTRRRKVRRHKAEAPQTARVLHARHADRQGNSGMHRPATCLAPVASIAKHRLRAQESPPGTLLRRHSRTWRSLAYGCNCVRMRLLLDSRVVDVPMSSNPTVVTLSSLK